MSVALSWDNWVGYALEDDSASPYADTPGVGVGDGVGPTYFLPLMGAESLGSAFNRTPSPEVLGLSMAPMAEINGRIGAAGTIPCSVIPGMLTGLKQWAYDRGESTSPYRTENNVASATVWIKTSGFTIRKFIGVKVSRLTIECPEGATYAPLSLDVIAHSEADSGVGVTVTPAQIYTAVYGSAACPVPAYTVGEAGIYFYTAGTGAYNTVCGAANLDEDVISWGYTIDNKLGEDGYRTNESNYRRRLDSLGREVTLTLTRDFRNTDRFSEYLANTQKAVGLQFVRGGHYLGIIMPRAYYEEGGPRAEGTKDAYNKESYTMRALGLCSDSAPLSRGDEVLFQEGTVGGGSS